jgi:hypothetical protein
MHPKWGWGMANFIYYTAIASGIFGAIGLVASFVVDESDGSMLTARLIRAVGFVLLAGLLKSYASV